jgi:hypothetical protein
MSNQRFIKLDAAGAPLAADATEWVAVEDTKTGLIWSVAETKAMTYKKALAYPKTVELCGFTDWRLPECDELLTLVDRSRISPAIAIEFFPNCKNDWYWSATPYAGSPGDYAWLVYFSYGLSYYRNQSSKGLVRVCRPRQ